MNAHVDLVARHFDGRAATYADKYVGQRPRHLYEHEKRQRARWTLEWIDRYARQCHAGRCLDVGCGDGQLLSAVLGVHQSWTGIGIDISNRMIEVAKSRSASTAHQERVRWHAGPLRDLEALADVVVSLGVMGYQVDQLEFVAELASRVVPGGLLIVSFANARSWLRRSRTMIQRARTAASRRARQIASSAVPCRQVDQRLGALGLHRTELRWSCFGLGLPYSYSEVQLSRWCEDRITHRSLAERLAQVAVACYQRNR